MKSTNSVEVEIQYETAGGIKSSPIYRSQIPSNNELAFLDKDHKRIGYVKRRVIVQTTVVTHTSIEDDKFNLDKEKFAI